MTDRVRNGEVLLRVMEQRNILHGISKRKAKISNFRRVLNIVCILLGISPASDCGLPTFRNPLSVPSSRAGCRV